MGEPVTFEIKDNGTTATIREVGTDRDAAWYLNRGLARAHRDLLNAERADGRKAQSRCAKGHACDRDRISDPTLLTPAQRASLVLCEKHETEIDAVCPHKRAEVAA